MDPKPSNPDPVDKTDEAHIVTLQAVSRTILESDLSDHPPSNVFYVDGTNGDDANDGKTWNNAFATVQAGVDASLAGDRILVAPKSAGYDEAVTIGKANLTIKGMGGRGAVFIEPSTTNATAILVTADDVTLINIGGGGDGTGPGLHCQGDVDRFRAFGCKFEGDDYAARLESTAAGAVSDTRFEDCEFAWASTGLHFKVSGGGDPVTQTYINRCTFHNNATVCVHAETTHTSDVWIKNSFFGDLEAGTQPTDFLLLNVASTTGFISGNHFATPTNATGVLTIAAGVHWGPNGTEAGWSTARPA